MTPEPPSPPPNPKPGERWGAYVFTDNGWWVLFDPDVNPAEPNLHSGEGDLSRLCSWLFWSFAMACGAVIVWLFLG